MTTPDAVFLAPDNGLLSGVLADYVSEPAPAAGVIPAPAGCVAFELSNPKYRLHPVSSTFHGRDVFSPAAAHLSLGVAPAEMGDPVGEIVWRPAPVPSLDGDWLRGEVIYADHFGNLITNIPAAMLGDAAGLEVRIKNWRIIGLSATFHQPGGRVDGQPITLVGSNGHLEIAVADGSAARVLEAGAGELVSVRLGGRPPS